MKINSLLFVIVALLPMGLMAQSDITLGATYLPYESTILIHVVNSANKSMRIRNSYGASSGSLIQFHLKDKAGKEISLYDAVFYEGIDYQRFVSINPRSTKTFRFLLRHLCPSNHSPADVYSVDVSCFINYSIPEEERFEFIHKVLPIKTKQDLMIHSMYDSHNHTGKSDSKDVFKHSIKNCTIALYKKCAEYALSKGIIIADTKFDEIGGPMSSWFPPYWHLR